MSGARCVRRQRDPGVLQVVGQRRGRQERIEQAGGAAGILNAQVSDRPPRRRCRDGWQGGRRGDSPRCEPSRRSDALRPATAGSCTGGLTPRRRAPRCRASQARRQRVCRSNSRQLPGECWPESGVQVGRQARHTQDIEVAGAVVEDPGDAPGVDQAIVVSRVVDLVPDTAATAMRLGDVAGARTARSSNGA